MNKNKALEVMLKEKCCVERQKDIFKCDRRCVKCDLLLPTEELLQAYDYVINMLTEKEEERLKGKWIKEDKPFGCDFVLVNTCSICGAGYIYHGTNENYCPNCGALMGEGDEE